MRRALALSLVALFLLPACAGIRLPERRASEAERHAYARALEPLPGDPSLAAQRLRDFRAAFPKSPLSDDAGVKLAELALEGDDPAAAARWYAVVIGEQPDADRSDRARLGLARIEAARGNEARARQLLEELRVSRLAPEERRDAWRLAADLATDPVARLRYLAALRGEEPDEQARALLDLEIDELLAGMDRGDLERAADQIERRVPAARIRLELADRALGAGDASRASSALAEAERLALEPAYAERQSALRKRLRLKQAGPPPVVELPTYAEALRRGRPEVASATGTLGVVLPLSGPFANVGEETLQGVLLAAGVFDALGSSAERPDVRLLVRDSAGDAARAAAAVRELAAREDVLAIVGPILSEACESAAAAADAAGIPLLTLTAREEVARGRPWVMRVRTRAQHEVDAVVDYAMEVLEARRFAILYPRDAYGTNVRAFFWDAVEARGGRVVGVAAYDPAATDFAEPIRQLVGWVLLTPEEEAAVRERERMMNRAARLPPEEAAALRQEARAMIGPEGRPLPPVVDFDALFIPDSHERLVLIAPQLAFHRVEGMTLLGPSGWNHPDVVRIGRQHVEGAVFAANFHPESEFPPVQSFVRRFRATFDRDPDDFAAQAYDAAMLALAPLARGYTTRDGVRDAILASPVHAGVTGVLAMPSDGNARRRPFLLTIQQGEVLPLDSL